MCLKRTKINKTRGRDWPIFNAFSHITTKYLISFLWNKKQTSYIIDIELDLVLSASMLAVKYLALLLIRCWVRLYSILIYSQQIFSSSTKVRLLLSWSTLALLFQAKIRNWGIKKVNDIRHQMGRKIMKKERKFWCQNRFWVDKHDQWSRCYKHDFNMAKICCAGIKLFN